MDISLDTELEKQLKDILKNTSFKNLTELINFILLEYITQRQEKAAEQKINDKEILENRLKNLGYL